MTADLRPDRIWLERAVVFVVAAVVACPAIYFIAIEISPARTASGHPTMPIGHAFLGLVGGIVVGLLAASRCGRRPRGIHGALA